jgi:hypothetical protein
MEDDQTKIPRNSSGLSGEYFVAAELYRRGFSVGMTIGNAKAVDLFAEKDGKVYQIQVKTIRSKKSSGWPMMREGITHDVVYVLVNLNGTDQPDYYILLPDEVISRIQQYTNRGILQLGRVKGDEFLGRWDRIK